MTSKAEAQQQQQAFVPSHAHSLSAPSLVQLFQPSSSAPAAHQSSQSFPFPAYDGSSPSPDFITGDRMREPDSGPTRRRTGSNNSGHSVKNGFGIGLNLGLGIGGRMRSVSQQVNKGLKEAQRAMVLPIRNTNGSPTSRPTVNVKLEDKETDMRTVRARSGSGSGYYMNLRMGGEEGDAMATVRRKKRSGSSSSAALNGDVSPLLPAALLSLPSSRASLITSPHLGHCAHPSRPAMQAPVPSITVPIQRACQRFNSGFRALRVMFFPGPSLRPSSPAVPSSRGTSPRSD